MTAYDLFKRTYMHHMGHAVRHTWTANKDDISPKAFIEQTFEEALCEYGVVYAYNNGFKLSRNSDFTNKDITSLKQIELRAGYWLCCFWLGNYGHNSEWTMLYFDNKVGAKATYKKLSYKYTRDWYWIKQVRKEV